MIQRIKVQHAIQISKDLQTVYEFIANLENDSRWRKEINQTQMSGRPQLGATATESSYLSKKQPAHLLQLVCIAYIQNEEIVYRTQPDSPIFLESRRRVASISPQETLVTYTIDYDASIVKLALGFNLPAFIIKYKTQQDMKAYLKKLKEVMEEKG